MIEAHNPSIACVLAAALLTAGCVAPGSSKTSAVKTETVIPSAFPARFDKASLVGCWTRIQEDGGNWLCFDQTGHYAIVYFFDDEGGDNVGRYTLTPDGQLVFDKIDDILQTRQLTVVRSNLSEIFLHGKSDNNRPIFMKLKKDSKNDFYKEISKTYF